MNILNIAVALLIFGLLGCSDSKKKSKESVLLAKGKMELQDFKGAIDHLTRAIEADPNNVEALILLGTSRNQIMDYSSAIIDIEKALLISDESAEAYVQRGIANHGLNDYDAAIIDFTMAIELNPSNAEAYYWRGIAKKPDIYSRIDNDPLGRIDDFSKAIKLRPDYAKAYFERGVNKILLRNDRYGGCIDIQMAIDNGYPASAVAQSLPQGWCR